MYRKILIPLLCLMSCGPFPDLRSRLEADLTPPGFTEIRIKGAEQLELRFDEPIRSSREDLQINPLLEITEFLVEGESLILTTAPQEPGQEYNLELSMEDEQGNGANLLLDFYGFNPCVPALLLNEFITRGSKNHPDLVEIITLSPGNMAGVTLYEGLPGDYTHRFIFPSFEVDQGTYVLVHFKPEYIPEEVNETHSPAESGGLDSAETAYDFWVKEGTGLSGNNGVLALYDSPAGTLLDGVFYSNRTRFSDQRYEGFGSESNRKRARGLVDAGGWQPAEDILYPEDGINPEDSTSTRSLCRDTAGTDTDTRCDWHIVPTRMSSFGTENSADVYIK